MMTAALPPIPRTTSAEPFEVACWEEEYFDSLFDTSKQQQQELPSLLEDFSILDAVLLDESDILLDDSCSTDDSGYSSSTSSHTSSSNNKNHSSFSSPPPPSSPTTSSPLTKLTKKSAGNARKNLSKEEKAELRKLRNRELASESRKRKNDELTRLREENAHLRTRLAEMERAATAACACNTSNNKRQRAHQQHHSTMLSAGATVASLISFVLIADEGEVRTLSTASVLITTLDACDSLDFSCLARFFVYALVSLCFCLVSMFCFQAIQSSPRTSYDARVLKSLAHSAV